MEENFSKQESLKLINEMIGKAKQSYVTKGIASMVWGSLIVFCSLVTRARIRHNFDIGFDVWALLFFAVLPQIFFGIKEKRGKTFVGHDETTANYVWTAFGISIFILTLYNIYHGSIHSASLFMILYGIPTFITGGIAKFWPMIVGGIVCWVLSAISVFTNTETDMLLMAASGLFAWLIPGIILWIRYQKQRRTNV